MPSYRNSGATHDSVRGQSRRHSGFPRQRRALPQSGCMFPDVEFCRKDTEGRSLCGFSRTLKRRAESKVIGDISPFPNITTTQRTPLLTDTALSENNIYLTALDLNCGLREPLHRVHGALVDQQGSPWTLQFTGETKAQHKEDAHPWLQGRSGAGAHSWPWRRKVGREGLQLWGSAGAYRAAGPGCTHRSCNSASWSPCSSQCSR